jgi:putative NADH-flavin reductase
MKVVVFGANGRTGKYIVQYALDAGHEVAAYVRDKNKLAVSHPQLAIIEGDVYDQQKIEAAIAGRDVVISALGQSDISGEVNLMSDAMKLIVPAMKNNGVKRVLAIGGLGVLQANETTVRMDMQGFPAMYRGVSEGHFKVYMVLKDSGLDWTFVCCPDIPDAPRTGDYKFKKDYAPGGKFSINTGDIADFMVKEMEANNFLNTRVGLSN